MSKKVEITNNVFFITDTVTSVVEVNTPADNISYLLSGGRVFFFLTAEKERTVGYLWSDMVDKDDVSFSSEQDLTDWLDEEVGEEASKISITSYRAEFEADLYIYSGFLLDSSPVVVRTKDSLVETGQAVTDLETDWTNRLSLTYV